MSHLIYSVGMVCDRPQSILFDKGIHLNDFKFIEQFIEGEEVDFERAMTSIRSYIRIHGDDKLLEEFYTKLEQIKPFNKDHEWVLWGVEADWSMGFIT